MYKRKCNYNYHGKILRKRDWQNSIHTKSINPLHKDKQSKYFIILKISTLTFPMIDRVQMSKWIWNEVSYSRRGNILIGTTFRSNSSLNDFKKAENIDNVQLGWL